MSKAKSSPGRHATSGSKANKVDFNTDPIKLSSSSSAKFAISKELPPYPPARSQPCLSTAKETEKCDDEIISINLSNISNFSLPDSIKLQSEGITNFCLCKCFFLQYRVSTVQREQQRRGWDLHIGDTSIETRVRSRS